MATYVISATGQYAWDLDQPTIKVHFATAAEADCFAARTDVKIIDDRKASGPFNVWD